MLKWHCLTVCYKLRIRHLILREVDQGASSDQILQCLTSISEVGVFCSERFPRERMDISNVVAELNRTKANFLHGRHGLPA
jgi:hypothetical protein